LPLVYDPMGVDGLGKGDLLITIDILSCIRHPPQAVLQTGEALLATPTSTDDYFIPVHQGDAQGIAPSSLLPYTTWGNGEMNATMPDIYRSCQPGMQPSADGTCEFCASGWISGSFDTLCQACVAGTIPTPDASQCIPCEIGKKSSLPGSTTCEKCDPGSFAAVTGSSDCQWCHIGSYAVQAGQSSCDTCGPGESTFVLTPFSNGEIEWSQSMGATDASWCGCDVGSRADQTTGKCIPCGEGMECKGMNQLAIKANYFSESEVSVYRCIADGRCKGGNLGEPMCAHGRKGISCANCEDGKKSHAGWGL
jgi:hypothetical protein